jgi:alkyl sulfatase BDS1-like metallo-beta-lactamase superfamily hydrolase
VGGVDLLREPGTEIVAQVNNASQQADDARLLPFRAARSAFAFAAAIAEARRPARGGDADSAPSQSRPEPTVTFRDRFDFELGGVRFELIATPGGETTDSLVVWLPEHRVCFAGNLFSALFGHFPNLVTIRGDRYRDALAFIDSLDRVASLEPELLLVGHHGPIEGADLIRSELSRLRGAVQFVHDQTVKGMNDGKDVYRLMREIRLPTDLEVGQGYGKVAWSVRAIWETYAGWFHHRSTTELYPAPPSGAHVDLVALAGGAEAVVSVARERLQGGDPVLALQLCEAALAADAEHPGALGVSLDAHRVLEARSENFWETSWLRRQIERLQSALGEG